MTNGYALPTADDLDAVRRSLRWCLPGERDRLRGLVRVGLHEGVEVTDGPAPGPLVTQVLCSAMPVAYAPHGADLWEPLARLALDAAYEATLLAAAASAAAGGSRRVLLTRLGEGAFGNDPAWVDAATARGLRACSRFDLDVSIVSYGEAPADLRRFVRSTGYASP
jgi:hypothetical protein